MNDKDGPTKQGQPIGILILQVLYGGFFILMGLNGFFHWFSPGGDQPPTNPEATGAFWGGITASGYMSNLIFATQAASGFFIATSRMSAFGLILLSPVLVNIVGYHLYVEPNGLQMALGLSAVHLVLAWCHRKSYQPLFCNC